MREVHEVPKFEIVNGVRKSKDNVLENIIFAPKSCPSYLDPRYLEEMLDFRNFDFYGVKLSNVRFEYCNMIGVSFLGASFDNVEFVTCAFEGKYGDDLAPFYNAGIRAYYTKTVSLDYYNHIICTVKNEDMCFLEDTDSESIIGYKKLFLNGYDRYKPLIAKLRIPFYADRIVYKREKCRASCAQVLDIYDLQGEHYSSAYSVYYIDDGFIYRIGHTVYSDSFNDDPMEVCTHGIHFFLTEDEAWNY